LFFGLLGFEDVKKATNMDLCYILLFCELKGLVQKRFQNDLDLSKQKLSYVSPKTGGWLAIWPTFSQFPIVKSTNNLDKVLVVVLKPPNDFFWLYVDCTRRAVQYGSCSPLLKLDKAKM